MRLGFFLEIFCDFLEEDVGVKNLKKLLSIILVASMLFTSNSAWTFAESVDEVETATIDAEAEEEEEEEIEETTIEAIEELVGAKLGEPELDEEELAEPEEEEFVELDEEESEFEETESVEANETTVVEEETTVGAKLGEPELDEEGLAKPAEETVGANACGARPEDVSDPDYSSISTASRSTTDPSENSKKYVFGSDGSPSSSTKGKDPDKTWYEEGDLFDPTGLNINVTYTGGITKTVEYNDETKNDFAFEPNPFATPDPEPLKYGDTEVKVSFRGSPQASYPVTVRRKIDTISYESGPDIKVYSKGDKFDPIGLVVHVTYVGGGEEDIPYDNTTASAFKFNPELNHIFDDSDIGTKVQVGFGNSAYVTIDMMDDIYPESFTFIEYDPKTDSVYVIPNPDAATETASVRGIFEEMLNEAIKNGAIGFHEFNASGANDSKNKYNKYTPATMNKEEALARFDKYITDGATGNLFIGPSFKKPEPAPDPKPNPTNYSSGSDNSGSDSSSSTSGPINPPNKNLDVINSFNSIPQGNLYNDVHFYDSLKLIPENMIAPKINIIDDKGNKGFGQWLIGPEMGEWHVLSGDLNANGTKGSAGFLKNTWCKLKWNGEENWFHFGNDTRMTLGWYREGDKIYFLQNDLNDKQYGKLVTGSQKIDGIQYDFNVSGELKSLTVYHLGDGKRFVLGPPSRVNNSSSDKVLSTKDEFLLELIERMQGFHDEADLLELMRTFNSIEDDRTRIKHELERPSMSKLPDNSEMSIISDLRNSLDKAKENANSAVPSQDQSSGIPENAQADQQRTDNSLRVVETYDRELLESFFMAKEPQSYTPVDPQSLLGGPNALITNPSPDPSFPSLYGGASNTIISD